MDKKTEYKIISQRAKVLLDKGENIDVDYKEIINGISMDDFVAFANSENGGAILIGVREDENNGIQRGSIIGCPVGDSERMKLVNKAKECTPIVEFDLIIENSAHLPFYRLEIPNGKEKPYCTAKGTYLIRGNGRNLPMLPNNLLNLFLKLESESFIKKFKNATDELSEKLNIINQISLQLEGRLEDIYEMSQTIEGLSEDAVSSSDEATDTFTDAQETISDISENIDYIIECNKAIMDKLDIEDPRLIGVRKGIQNILKKFFKSNKDLKDVEQLVFETYCFYKKEIIKNIFNEELKIIKENK